MWIVRAFALLLAVTVGAGPALLDRCLISCHDEPASESAIPSCHEHPPASDTASVHGVSACSHDHEGLPADAVSDARGSGPRHLIPVAVMTAVAVVALPQRPSAAVALLDSRPSTSYVPSLVQLRI